VPPPPVRGNTDAPDQGRYSRTVAEEFDPQEMVVRFRARAEAVRNRGLPPIEGPDRQRFIEQAQIDFMDYAMLGDADASIEDGVLIFRVDLRPQGDPAS
jgi:hypothetical protein